jgi:hypothetical protein
VRIVVAISFLCRGLQKSLVGSATLIAAAALLSLIGIARLTVIVSGVLIAEGLRTKIGAFIASSHRRLPNLLRLLGKRSTIVSLSCNDK